MNRTKWTEEEVFYLTESVGKYTLSTIAQKLGRSETAVLMKMKRLGIANTRSQTGLLTTLELANLLKINSSSVRRWINEHGLKCTKKKTRTKRSYYFIDPEDFWEFAFQHREKINFSNIEPRTILPEPDWVAQERKKPQKSKQVKGYKRWTPQEEELLKKYLFEEGYSIAKAAKTLDRSILSVYRKFIRASSYESNSIGIEEGKINGKTSYR
ncbi:hypothetical protein [Alkalihalobacterium sp. APHAB7]|uniref:hypothetical protein n=1 Tax=Alkalihalobacterium sp. APHAB7 TaxID=3402081 RepID=UPI003AAB6B41